MPPLQKDNPYQGVSYGITTHSKPTWLSSTTSGTGGDTRKSITLVGGREKWPLSTVCKTLSPLHRMATFGH